jgi:hypothetical protein
MLKGGQRRQQARGFIVQFGRDAVAARHGFAVFRAVF